MLRLIFIGQLFITICICLAAMVTSGADLAIIASASIPSTIVALFLVGRRDLDVFSPLVLVFFMATVGSLLKSINLVYFDSGLVGSEFSLNGLPVDALHSGALILSLAMLALVIGYTLMESISSPTRQFKFKQRIRFSDKKIYMTIVVIIGISLFFSVEFMRQTGFAEAYESGVISAKRTHEASVGVAPRGAALGWLRLPAQTLPQVMMFIFLANILKSKNPTTFNYIVLAVLILCSSIVPIIQSARLELIYSFLIGLVIFHYSRKRISIPKIATMATVLLIAVALLGQIRNQNFNDGPGDGLSFQSVVDRTLARAYFMGIGKTAVIADKVPSEIDYLKGESLTYFLLAPIPRTMWPEKPVVRIGLFIGQEIFDKNNETGVPPGFPAELYLNFGHIGVVLGMFIVGAAYAGLYVATIQRRNSPMSIVIYSVGTILFSFTLLTGDLTVFMSQIFRYGLMLLIIIWLVRDRAPKAIGQDYKLA